MKIQQTAEKILGRKLKKSESIDISRIQTQEEKLGIQLPKALKNFYLSVGKNALFTEGFQRFAEVEELFAIDGKLVFLEENQAVVHWSVGLADEQTIFQTTDKDFSGSKKVEWFAEEFELEQFLEMLLYFQCAMSSEEQHLNGESGFEYFVSIDVDEYWENENAQKYMSRLKEEGASLRGNGLAIYFSGKSLTMSFLDEKGEIDYMILNCSKNEKDLDYLIGKCGFSQL